jgi:ribosomal protein L32E
MELIGINDRYFKEKEKALKYEKWYKSRGYNANYRKTLDKKLIVKGFVHAVTILHFGYRKTQKCKTCKQSWDRKVSVTNKGTATYVD